MVALALLTAIVTRSGHTAEGLIAMTVPEAQRPLNALNPAQPSITHTLQWSI